MALNYDNDLVKNHKLDLDTLDSVSTSKMYFSEDALFVCTLCSAVVTSTECVQGAAVTQYSCLKICL